MPRKKRIGRPRLRRKDRLSTQIRVDVGPGTRSAVQREMMKSHQSRSKVVRTLIREALRARGYKLVESFDEKRDRERDS